MTITVQEYNIAPVYWADVRSNLTHLYAMLLNSSAAFDATHATVSAVAGANEVSGNGWTAGGVNLSNVTLTTVDTNKAMVDADDISVTATGGSITARSVLVYMDVGGAGTTKIPLFRLLASEDRVAAADNPFVITWPATGIARISQA